MDKRRFFSMLYFVLLTCLLILPCPKDVSGADWEPYTTGQGIIFFYDADNIIYLPNNIIRAWVLMIAESEESRLRYLMNERKAGRGLPDNWGHLVTLYEINCKNKTYAVIQSTSYSTKKELIQNETIEHPSHEYMPPGTMSEELYKNICIEKDSKKKGR
jgi:hypothetical protein